MNKRLNKIFETINHIIVESNLATGKEAHRVRAEKGKAKKAGKKVVRKETNKPKREKQPQSTRSEGGSKPKNPKGVLSVASAIAQGEDPSKVADLSDFTPHDLSTIRSAVKEFGELHKTNPGAGWERKYFPHLSRG
jgi:hypothetical protein